MIDWLVDVGVSLLVMEEGLMEKKEGCFGGVRRRSKSFVCINVD